MDQIIDKDKRRFISNLKSIMGAGVAIGLINAVGLNSALAFERITHAPISKGKLFTYEEMVVLASVVQTIYLNRYCWSSGCKLSWFYRSPVVCCTY